MGTRRSVEGANQNGVPFCAESSFSGRLARGVASVANELAIMQIESSARLARDSD